MAATHNLFGFTWKHSILILPIIGYSAGAYLEYLETLRMSSFRDRSALYGKPLSERKQPSWPLWQ